MRSFFGLGSILVSALIAACASAQTLPDGLPADADAGTTGNTIPEDPANEPPHALGTIVLGESRTAATGDSNPLISASFVPDAKLTKSCTRKVGACEILEVPKCKTGTMEGCGTGEACTFDDDCKAKCVAACTKSCGAGEVCAFKGSAPSGDTPTDDDMLCRKRDRFDAGALAFAGTTQAITLFPPYGVTPDGNGAPFLARTEIRVQASGAAAAGFEKFDEKFLSTTFLETNPPLAEIPRSEVFGSGALTIGWVKGEDTVYVTVSGAAGSAKCPADDKAGTFELPREVIREVTEEESGGTTGGLSIAVTRERRELRKDKKTFGELAGGQTVQPQGWIELITRSSEAHSFQSCSTGTSACGETCVNLQSDTKNCGSCGKACATGQYCSAGLCL